MAVSNSSPLISLVKIEQLHVMPRLFDQVLIPPAVRSELGTGLAIPDWLHVQQVTRHLGTELRPASLGAGERAAISLAVETGADWVILDDRQARREAERLGLSVVGTVGILMGAKRRGYLSSLRPHLDALIEADFRLSDRVYRDALRAVGEAG